MKRSSSHSIASRERVPAARRIPIRYIRIQELRGTAQPLPIGRNTPRAIVLNLTTTFPLCAWAFLKMI